MEKYHKEYIKRHLRQFEFTAQATIDAIKDYKEQIECIESRLERLYDELEVNNKMVSNLKKMLEEG